ncbi:MAG: hypothetical protein ACYCOU_16260 [Sulfobacillus sp.]
MQAASAASGVGGVGGKRRAAGGGKRQAAVVGGDMGSFDGLLYKCSGISSETGLVLLHWRVDC